MKFKYRACKRCSQGVDKCNCGCGRVLNNKFICYIEPIESSHFYSKKCLQKWVDKKCKTVEEITKIIRYKPIDMTWYNDQQNELSKMRNTNGKETRKVW